MLWLWCRLAAAALICPPSPGTSISHRCSLQKKKRRKKRTRKKEALGRDRGVNGSKGCCGHLDVTWRSRLLSPLWRKGGFGEQRGRVELDLDTVSHAGNCRRFGPDHSEPWGLSCVVGCGADPWPLVTR